MAVYHCDAVIIGSGHNGLVLACYLARAGLKVYLPEARLEAGGGLSTEEITVPGVWNNMHSFFHETIDVMPPYRDFELDRWNAEYIVPPVQAGLPLAGGGELVLYDDVEATCASLARFSRRDADTWRELHRRFRPIEAGVVVPAMYRPPSPPGEQEARIAALADGPEYLRLARLSPRRLVDALFETEALKALLLHNIVIPRGVVSDYDGMGGQVLGLIAGVQRAAVCKGGSHLLGHAMWRFMSRHGGQLKAVSPVTRILVEAGRATGVELLNGDTIRAGQLVASSIDVYQTFLQLLAPEELPAGLAERVRQVEPDEFAVFAVHLALRRPLGYAAGGDLDRALKVDVGLESTADVDGLWRDVRAGDLPRAGLFAAQPTLFDRTQSPVGFHSALLWQIAPYELRSGSWEQAKDEYVALCLDRWRRYAPGLTAENIMMATPITPPEMVAKQANLVRGGLFGGRVCLAQSGWCRPLPELSGYRTPIERLYLCGSCCHPGGGITGAPGYNAANVIAADLGLQRWWNVA